MTLDRLTVADCVRLINEEDATVAAAVARAHPSITEFIEAVLERMKPNEPHAQVRGGSGCPGLAGSAARPGDSAVTPGLACGETGAPLSSTTPARLLYFGAGTSGRLGVLDASECPPTFQTPPGMIVGVIAGGDAALRVSSEGKEDDYDGARAEIERLQISPRDSVLGIAAGGTTPYVLGALDLCAARGALTALLTCSRISTPPFVRHHIIIDTGPEIITGSTRMKAGTATKLVLNTITTTLMVHLGKVHENLMVDLRATNDKLRDRAARIVSTLTGLPRNDAFALLDRAAGSCKAAIVMHRRHCSLPDAEARLAQAQGRLRDAINAVP